MSTTYTDPIKEKILDDLEEVVSRIKRVNGYLLDIEKVERYDRNGNIKDPQPIIIITSGEEDPRNHPSMQSMRMLTVFLDLWFIHDTNRYKQKTDTLLNYFACDIERAVMADETRNGLASSTDITNIVPFDLVEGQSWDGIIVTLDIKYSHKVGDPKTQL